MNEQERNDLLIRVDANLSSLEKRFDRIELLLSNLNCQSNIVKIKQLEHIVIGTLTASIIAVTGAFWEVLFKK